LPISASSNLRPIVKYYDQRCIAIGDTTTYNVDNWHYWIHFIYIKGLEPGMKYNYKLGFIESNNITIRDIYSNEMGTFKSMSPVERQEKEIVYMYADMETIMPLSFEVMKSIIKDFNRNKNEQAVYIVHVGDLAYAGTEHELEIETIWDLFMNRIASQIPYMTAIGNHEKYFNYTSYTKRFFMPSKTNPASFELDGNFYFSFVQ
jgi:hypothetical protein